MSKKAGSLIAGWGPVNLKRFTKRTEIERNAVPK